MTRENRSVVFVTVHERPFPLPHYYSNVDVISDALGAQRDFRCCPTTRAIMYRETNFIIIIIIIIITINMKTRNFLKQDHGVRQKDVK